MIYEVEVCVVGGGTAGVCAALAAARNGARTFLVERFGAPGGATTTGLVGMWDNFYDGSSRQIIGGIPFEILTKLVEEQGTPYSDLETAYRDQHVVYDEEILSCLLLKMLLDAGVSLMLHTFFQEAIVENDCVTGIKVQNKSGIHTISAKTVIDASGDADVAASSGVPCIWPQSSEKPPYGPFGNFGFCYWIGNTDIPRLFDFVKSNYDQPDDGWKNWFADYLGEPLNTLKDSRYGFWLQPTSRDAFEQISRRYREKDCLDIKLTPFCELVREATEKGDFSIRGEIPGGGHVLFDSGNGMVHGSRRLRRIFANTCRVMGLSGTDGEDITRAEACARIYVGEQIKFFRKYVPGFEKAMIQKTGSWVMHRYARLIEGEYTLSMEDVKENRRFADVVCLYERCDIPYRMMLPKKIDNLLVSGKCSSGGTITRHVPYCMAMGEAAGTAAAVSVSSGLAPRNIDIKAVQDMLENQGVILSLDNEEKSAGNYDEKPDR